MPRRAARPVLRGPGRSNASRLPDSCVEVATLGDTVITRDSKDPQHTVAAYTRSEWTAFTDGVKNGEFDI